MKKEIRLFQLFILTIFLSNCSSGNGDKFIGQWLNPQLKGGSSEVITITENGDTYLVRYSRFIPVIYDYVSTEGSFKEIATYKEGSLVINDKLKLSLIENGSKILMAGTEYLKSKDELPIDRAANYPVEKLNPTRSQINQAMEKVFQDSIMKSQEEFDKVLIEKMKAQSNK